MARSRIKSRSLVHTKSHVKQFSIHRSRIKNKKTHVKKATDRLRS